MNIISSGHLATFSGERYLLELSAAYTKHEYVRSGEYDDYLEHRYYWQGQGKVKILNEDNETDFAFFTPALPPNFSIWSHQISYPIFADTIISSIKDAVCPARVIDMVSEMIVQQLDQIKTKLLEQIAAGKINEIKEQIIRWPVIPDKTLVEQGLLAEASGQVRLNLAKG